MSALTDAAAAARAAELAAEEAAKVELRKALRDEAKAAITQVIAPMTWAQAGLSFVHTDYDNRLTVASDATISLSAYKNDNENWVIHLATKSGNDWTRVSERLRNLADLGEALAVQS